MAIGISLCQSGWLSMFVDNKGVKPINPSSMDLTVVGREEEEIRIKNAIAIQSHPINSRSDLM